MRRRGFLGLVAAAGFAVVTGFSTPFGRDPVLARPLHPAMLHDPIRKWEMSGNGGAGVLHFRP